MKRFLCILALLLSLPCSAVAKTVKVGKKAIKHVGFASYYGRQHEGKKMSNGEKFRKAKLTAAHLWLPFGTRIRVFNMMNGKSVDVTITDRGPHKKGRILDLSEAAARKIDLVRYGVAKVMWTPLPEPEKTELN